MIPFNYDLINTGNFEVKTKSGLSARFLGKINNDSFPLVFAVNDRETKGQEAIESYTVTGKYFSKVNEDSDLDLVLVSKNG